MFKEETVFILGAGASWHYGYPTGADLVKKVIDAGKIFLQCLEIKTDGDYGRGVGVVQERHLNMFVENKTRNDVKNGCEEFINLLGQANPLVIDYFLSKQSARIREIGKFLIAWVILECESNYMKGSKEHKSNNHNLNRLTKARKGSFDNIVISDLIDFNDDWYRFISHKLVDDCDSKTRHPNRVKNFLSDNKVKFITFNYDVSLETSLSKALKAMPDYFSNEEINLFMQNDKFLHIYGSVQESNSERDLDFKTKSKIIENIDKIYNSSKMIRTIGEDAINDGNSEIVCDKHLNDETIKKAKIAIQYAKNVYILGYGFDARNNERIGLDELKVNLGGKKIYFTNYNDHDSLNKRVNKLMSLYDGREGVFKYFRGSRNFIPSVFYNEAKNYETNSYDRSTRNVYEALEMDFDFI